MKALLVLIPLLASCSVMDHVEQRTEQIAADLDQRILQAQEEYTAGDITLEEYQSKIAEAQALAQADLNEVPEEARDLVDLNREKLVQRGKSYGFTLLQLILGITLGGAGGGAAVVGVKRRKSSTDEQ